MHNVYVDVIIQHTNNTSSYKMCAHIFRTLHPIPTAWEASLAHTQGPFMDSASQTRVQHVPRASGREWHGAGTSSPCPWSRAGTGHNHWWHNHWCTSLIKGLLHRQERRGPAPGTDSTDTAESVYLVGYFLEAQESTKKFQCVLQVLQKTEVLNGPVKLASDTRKYQWQHFW